MKLDYKQIYKFGKYCQEIAKDCYDQGTKEAVRGKQKIA